MNATADDKRVLFYEIAVIFGLTHNFYFEFANRIS